MVSVEELPVTVAVEGMGEFVDVEAAGRGIDDVFVDSTFLVEFVGVA